MHRNCKIIHTDLKPENVLLVHELPSRKVLREGLKRKESSNHVPATAAAPTPTLPASTSETVTASEKTDEAAPAPQEPAPQASAPQPPAAANDDHPHLTGEQRKKLKKKLRQKQKRLTTCQPQDREVLEHAITVLMERLSIHADTPAPQAGQQQQQKQQQQVNHDTASGQARPSVQSLEDLTQMLSDISTFDCKIIDLGNACWTHHHFTDQIQVQDIFEYSG